VKKWIPTWRRLRRYGNNKIIKSSYFWVVAVPIVAKLVPQLESIISSENNKIILSLPFSWQMFYFGSIFFALAAWIYSSKCPHLIQTYSRPNDYWETGHGLRELNGYAKETFEGTDKYDAYNEVLGISAGIVHDINIEKNSKFFFVQENTQYKRMKWRIICTCGFIFGAIFFVIVLIQNFIFVLNQVVSN